MWCPKCKNEYREGITVCADCGTALVEFLDETKEDTELLHAFDEEAAANKLISYLEYSGISARCERLEEGAPFGVFVGKKEYKQARKAFAAFFTVETAEQYETILALASDEAPDQTDATEPAAGTGAAGSSADLLEPADSEDAEYEAYIEETERNKTDREEELRSAVSAASQGSYVSKAEKSADYRSSAITFLFFGVAGLIVMGLHWAGAFQFFSTLSSVILTVLFAGFLIVGIDSLNRAKKAKTESLEEERFVSELKTWLEQNLTLAELTAVDQADLSEEANFLNEMNEMKKIIRSHFGELDPAFLDQFTEEYYNEHFDNM